MCEVEPNKATVQDYKTLKEMSHANEETKQGTFQPQFLWASTASSEEQH